MEWNKECDKIMAALRDLNYHPLPVAGDHDRRYTALYKELNRVRNSITPNPSTTPKRHRLRGR